MAVTPDRKYTSQKVYEILEWAKGKTLGEVDRDRSRQFDRTEKSSKITGIAGDVIEQSVFGYARDSRQESDIEIDGELTELKTTGVRIPQRDLAKVKGKKGDAYNVYLRAKEGISVTRVTFELELQTEFDSSHFYEKVRHMLIVFYEYKSYAVVPASGYKDFPIVDYCYNTFSDSEMAQLRSDWEIVRNHLITVYDKYESQSDRDENLIGFTHQLRPQLLLIELVPGFKRRPNGNYQRPRYRLKQTFVDYIVKGHFDTSRKSQEIELGKSFSSFKELDSRCRELTRQYGGMTLAELKNLLNIGTDLRTKDFTSKCIMKMFGAEGSSLNQISDFTRAGIIAKTIIMTPTGGRTEDMKLSHIDFDEWADRDIDFEDSAVYSYFCDHSFLCPIFCEHDPTNPELTTFEGFKRFAFDDEFIDMEVKRVWEDSRRLIHTNELHWEYEIDSNGDKIRNKSGSFKGAPNFPKSSTYTVFFRGGSNNSSDKNRTECVNNIRMLPQFFWLKGIYVINKLKEIPYL